MGPRETIERWLERFNAGDAPGIAALYAEDAVNHQVVFVGRPVCTPINVVAEGEWVALEWVDPEGFRGCGFFHVHDGLIVQQRGYWDSAQLRAAHPDMH
jgi:ketosteroid isomerase-like protein